MHTVFARICLHLAATESENSRYVKIDMEPILEKIRKVKSQRTITQKTALTSKTNRSEGQIGKQQGSPINQFLFCMYSGNQLIVLIAIRYIIAYIFPFGRYQSDQLKS